MPDEGTKLLTETNLTTELSVYSIFSKRLAVEYAPTTFIKFVPLAA